MRPKENLEDNEYVCAYVKLEDAVEGRKCIPIRGGDRWFKVEFRIPVLDRIKYKGKLFYKVVLPFTELGDRNLLIKQNKYVYVHDDSIFDAYIPVSEKIAEDVWLKSRDLQNLQLVLSNFSDDVMQFSGSELRESFVFLIKDALERVIRKPLYYRISL